MSNANRAILLGRLGNDPDVGVIPGTQTVAAKLSIATTEKWRDKQSGEQKEKTTWHNVKAYGRTAEVIRDYLKKGALVYIDEDNDSIITDNEINKAIRVLEDAKRQRQKREHLLLRSKFGF